MPLPMTGARKTSVRSMKPSGVKVALPIRKNSGEGGGSAPFPPCGALGAEALELEEEGKEAAATVGVAAATLAITPALGALVATLAAGAGAADKFSRAA